VPAWLVHGDDVSCRLPGCGSVCVCLGDHRGAAGGPGALCRCLIRACCPWHHGATPGAGNPSQRRLGARASGAGIPRAAGPLYGGLALGAYAAGDFGAGLRTGDIRRISALANASDTGSGTGNFAGVDDANRTTISGHALVGGPARAPTNLFPGSTARLEPSRVSTNVTVHQLAGRAEASEWATCRRCSR
jgi:hypothetical protein